MFGLNNYFGIGAAVLSIIATVPYIWSIVKGQTKPSGPSWWTWALLAGVTATSSWSAGAPLAVLILPIWLCFLQLLIAVLSLKYGDNNWDLLNKLCVVSSIVGIGLWWITGEPLIALGISVLADLFASIPNFRHCWKNPEQENRTGWTLGWGSAVFQMLAINNWSLAESGWAIYFFINMSIVLIFIWRPALRRRLKLT